MTDANDGSPITIVPIRSGVTQRKLQFRLLRRSGTSRTPVPVVSLCHLGRRERVLESNNQQQPRALQSNGSHQRNNGSRYRECWFLLTDSIGTTPRLLHIPCVWLTTPSPTCFGASTCQTHPLASTKSTIPLLR
jgi:hypothetical protein